MTAEKKGGLASLLGGDTSDAESDEEAGADYDSAKADAASKVMKAMKASDATAFASALEDFVSLCME